MRIPILISDIRTGRELPGVTRDASTQGVFLYVDDWPLDLVKVKFRLVLPENGLSEAMYALGEATVVRVERDLKERKVGVALAVDSYNLEFNGTQPS